MKTSIKVAVITLAIGFSTFAATNAVRAESVDTVKGSRLTTAASAPLRTIDDFKSLRKGDKVAVHCPMMKETIVTTVRNVDSKGFSTITETGKGYVGGCHIILRKKVGSKGVESVMVCPDGTLTPAECRKM